MRCSTFHVWDLPLWLGGLSKRDGAARADLTLEVRRVRRDGGAHGNGGPGGLTSSGAGADAGQRSLVVVRCRKWHRACSRRAYADGHGTVRMGTVTSRFAMGIAWRDSLEVRTAELKTRAEVAERQQEEATRKERVRARWRRFACGARATMWHYGAAHVLPLFIATPLVFGCTGIGRHGSGLPCRAPSSAPRAFCFARFSRCSQTPGQGPVAWAQPNRQRVLLSWSLVLGMVQSVSCSLVVRTFACVGLALLFHVLRGP